MKAPTNTPISIDQLPPSRHGGVMQSADLMAAINEAAGVTSGDPIEEVPAGAPANPSTPAAPATTPPQPSTNPPKAAAGTAPPPAAATVAGKPAAPAADAGKPPKKEGIVELREAHERATRKVQELEASLTATNKEKADAFAKLATLDEKLSGYEKRVRDEFEPAMRSLTEKEKLLQAKEERIRILDYQSSDEFHERYVGPLAAARAEADEFVGQLVVADGAGAERPATSKDFDAVLVQPNPQAAARLAKQLFGEDVYQSVMTHRMKLLSLERSRAEAVKNAHLASAKWVEETQVKQAQARQGFKSSLSARVEAMLASDEVFKVADDDAEAKAAIEEGRAFAEELLDPQHARTPEDFVELVAKGQHRIRAYPRQLQTIRRQAAEITNLKKQIDGYMRSEPTVETRNGGQPAPVYSSGKEAAMASLDAAIAAVAR